MSCKMLEAMNLKQRDIVELEELRRRRDDTYSLVNRLVSILISGVIPLQLLRRHPPCDIIPLFPEGHSPLVSCKSLWIQYGILKKKIGSHSQCSLLLSEILFAMGSISSDSQSLHVVLFPFMAKGHTIPLLHLAGLLRRRFHDISLTIVTTTAHSSFISQFLFDASVSIIELPFPQDVAGIPAGVESTDTLPSLSLFPEFCMATKMMQQDFEKELQALPRVSFLVSDGFLWWTLESASKFGIPRISFDGMSNFTSAITIAVMKDRLLLGGESDDELITVTSFPWVKVTRNDWDPAFSEPDTTSLHSQFLMASIHATGNSYGMIVNSLYELEAVFCDYLTKDEGRRRAWNIGPLCLVEKPKEAQPVKPAWLQWLDQKLSQGKPVLYVAFGTQADISPQQLNEIAIGLEESEVNFLWAKKGRESSEVDEGFEERVKERGKVVREWIDQWEVLKHESVKGFLSHCGWNSVLESISCGVPILAWPIMAEQALNARQVVEEIKVGLRAVETRGGSVKGFVKGTELQRLVRELMEGEKGKQVRKKAVEISEMAKKAMEEDGSSWRNLGELVEETCSRQEQKN